MNRLLISVACFISVWCSTSAFRYEISGQVADTLYHGKQLYLLDASLPKHNNEYIRIDSCRCTPDGKFKFENNYDEEDLGVVCAVYDIPGGVRTDYFGYLVLSGGKTEMDMQKVLLPSKGSRENMLLRDFISEINETSQKIRVKELDPVEGKKMAADINRKTVAANAENAVGRFALYNLSNCIDGAEWLDFYNSCSPYLQQHAPAVEVAARLNAVRKTESGKPFIDISGVDIEGKKTSLSDIAGKGRVTVVDFWASWCNPCIREIKSTLKPLSEKYGENGKLNIVGIAVNDKPEDTRDAINKYGITWPQIMETSESPVQVYGFNSIPFIVVIGPDGKIAAKGLREEELTSFVESMIAGQ